MSSCPKCQGSMESGFIPDFNYGSVLELKWVEGPPEKGLLRNLKTKGKRQFAISTDRCTRCGYLDLYARETNPPR